MPVTVKISYQFKNQELLHWSLTHRSAGCNHNERLEFLGDSVLNCIISVELFNRYPHASEGELSRLRASLVKGETLAEIAKTIKLNKVLILGDGEIKSGGELRTSILANAVEALIGGIYLDSDYDNCKNVVLDLYNNYFKKLPLLEELRNTVLKDPKTRLQELLQSYKYGLPQYTIEQVLGKPHNQTFQVSCYITELDLLTKGIGSSKRKAEQVAADKMLQTLYSKHHD